jgi:hypothetical protein
MDIVSDLQQPFFTNRSDRNEHSSHHLCYREPLVGPEHDARRAPDDVLSIVRGRDYGVKRLQ